MFRTAEQAGVWGAIILGIGITALLIAIAAAFMAWAWRARARTALTLAMSATLLIVLLFIVGGIGTMHGYGRVAEMLSYLEGEDAARVERIGPVLASAPIRLAIQLGVPAAIFTASVWFRGLRRFRAEQHAARYATSIE